jgi:formylglycine-generating enzyme required for sulfatase activity
VWANVSPGTNKSITWDAGADVPGQAGNFKVRVFADDGNCFASMCFVPCDAESGYSVGDFWIGKYEVTNLQYCEYLNRAQPDSDFHWDSRQEITRSGTAGDYVYEVNAGRGNYPMRHFSFNDAEAFCQWLRTETGLTYRLPTEEEWEKAAGWDPVLDKLWTYGYQQDTIDCNWSNYNNCIGGPTEVGYYNGVNPSTNDAKSYYGCYDMTGNLFEWTSSIYSGIDRVYRGGSWSYGAPWCAVTYRWHNIPGNRFTYIGIRLVIGLD